MNRGATFDKSLRLKAKENGKAVIAMDVDNRRGRWQFWGAIDHDLSARLWKFVHLVYTGTDPRAAFDEVWPETEPAANPPLAPES